MFFVDKYKRGKKEMEYTPIIIAFLIVIYLSTKVDKLEGRIKG